MMRGNKTGSPQYDATQSKAFVGCLAFCLPDRRKLLHMIIVFEEWLLVRKTCCCIGFYRILSKKLKSGKDAKDLREGSPKGDSTIGLRVKTGSIGVKINPRLGSKSNQIRLKNKNLVPTNQTPTLQKEERRQNPQKNLSRRWSISTIY